MYKSFINANIGAGINSLFDKRYQNNRQNINDFGTAAANLFQKIEEDKKEKQQRDSAISFLGSIGIDKDTAAAAADSLGNKESASLYLNRKWGQDDKADDRKYAEGQKKADREYEDSREQRIYERGKKDEADALKNKRMYESNESDIKSLWDRYNLLSSKSKEGGLVDENDIAELNETKRQLDYLLKNSDHHKALQFVDAVLSSNAGTDEYTLQKVKASLEGFKNADGTTNVDALEKYIDSAKFNNKWTPIASNYKDLIESLVQNDPTGKLAGMNLLNVKDFNKNETYANAEAEKRKIAFENNVKNAITELSDMKSASGKYRSMTSKEIKKAFDALGYSKAIVDAIKKDKIGKNLWRTLEGIR